MHVVLGLEFKARLDLLGLHLLTRVAARKIDQKKPSDIKAKTGDFGDTFTLVTDISLNTIVQRVSPYTFLVEIQEGFMWHYHIDMQTIFVRMSIKFESLL